MTQLAVGVLSGTSLKADATARRFKERRDLVRQTWLQSSRRASSSSVVHFVLRCGGLPSDHSVRMEPDVVCANDIAAAETRMRGPILALHWWIRYALLTYPNVPFIGKSDDDVFLYLADIETHLRSIPAESAPHAYYGAINFYHVHERVAPNGDLSRFRFHGFGPSYFWAKHVARVSTAQMSNAPLPQRCSLSSICRDRAHRSSNMTRFAPTSPLIQG